MAAIITDVSTKLVLVLDAGNKNGKKVTKNITISGIREDASGDELMAAVRALEKVLKHPVAVVKLHTISTIEMAAGLDDDAEAAPAVRRLSGGEPIDCGEKSTARPFALPAACRGSRHWPGNTASAPILGSAITAAEPRAGSPRPLPQLVSGSASYCYRAKRRMAALRSAALFPSPAAVAACAIPAPP